MRVLYKGKSFKKMDIEIYDDINKRKENVRFFIVENVDLSSIKRNHKIKNEVDGVLRIPVNDLLIRKPIKVPSKINPKAKVDLIYSHRLNIFLKRIQRKSSDYQYLFDSMFLHKGTFRKSFSKRNNFKGRSYTSKGCGRNPNNSRRNNKDFWSSTCENIEGSWRNR